MEIPRPNPEQFMAPSVALPRLGEDTPLTRGPLEDVYNREPEPQFLRPDRHVPRGGVYAVRAALGGADNLTPESTTGRGDTVGEGSLAPNSVGASEPRELEASKEVVTQQAGTVDSGSQDLESVETDGVVLSHDDDAESASGTEADPVDDSTEYDDSSGWTVLQPGESATVVSGNITTTTTAGPQGAVVIPGKFSGSISFGGGKYHIVSKPEPRTPDWPEAD